MGGSGATVPGIVGDREERDRALPAHPPDQVGKNQLVADRDADETALPGASGPDQPEVPGALAGGDVEPSDCVVLI